MAYNRVIPRDLFNEAKLLKCLGVLSLNIHDDIDNLSSRINMVLEDESKGFMISQNELDGSIQCSNLYLFDNNGTPIYLSSGLNSRLAYPLEYQYKAVQDFVFDDDGTFSEAFKITLDLIKKYS